MSRKIDWNHYRRTMKGIYGKEVAPMYSTSGQFDYVTQQQLKWIHNMVEYLESKDVPAAHILKESNGEYKTNPYAAIKVANTLKKMFRDNGLDYNWHYEYVNLCVNKETGKKIKYRTRHRYCAPVGYEFLGELESRHADGWMWVNA